jgi:hypothetical protein
MSLKKLQTKQNPTKQVSIHVNYKNKKTITQINQIKSNQIKSNQITSHQPCASFRASKRTIFDEYISHQRPVTETSPKIHRPKTTLVFSDCFAKLKEKRLWVYRFDDTSLSSFQSYL